MKIGFYVVDELALPEAALRVAARVSPDAVVGAMLAQAGPWGDLQVASTEFADVFHLVDEACGTGEFLLTMALAGSPHAVLAEQPGAWRLGYFAVALVELLQPLLNTQDEHIADALRSLSETANDVYTHFRQCMDEAFLRGLAVAIVYRD